MTATPERPDAGLTRAAEISGRRERRLRAVLLLNIGIVVAQVVFGFLAHSIGLLADAGHNLTDVAAILASIVAIRLARRPPTDQRSFGWHRATILAAQANAASILALSALIFYEGARRLVHPQAVHGWPVLIVSLVAMLANGASALALVEAHEHERGHAHGDLNMRSALLHMAGDAAASAGVAIAGAVILLTHGLYRLDPAISIAIGVLIAWQAWKLLRETSQVLLEGSPAGLDLEALQRTMSGVHGVEAVHDLHVWSLASDMHALSAHVVLDGHPSLEHAQAVANEIKATIAKPFAIAHATLELECENCEDDGPACDIDPAGATTSSVRTRTSP